MRASFSSRCDEYYNLKMLLIGESFRAKAILERRPFGRRKKNEGDRSGYRGNLDQSIVHG